MEQNIMTPEEFKNRMCELSKNDDVVYRHMGMDRLICEVLTSLGYGEGVNIFNSTYMWYA